MFVLGTEDDILPGYLGFYSFEIHNKDCSYLLMHVNMRFLDPMRGSRQVIRK